MSLGYSQYVYVGLGMASHPEGEEMDVDESTVNLGEARAIGLRRTKIDVPQVYFETFAFDRTSLALMT